MAHHMLPNEKPDRYIGVEAMAVYQNGQARALWAAGP